jgi:hypothetical protein
MRIERTREIKGNATTEIAYYVTSLLPAEADAGRLLALARAHWGIENKLHWRRDVSMNEDRCRVRAGARPLAAMPTSSSPCSDQPASRFPQPAKPTPPIVPPPYKPSPAGLFEWPWAAALAC